ncbi:hypothetical protein MJ749_25320 [Paenibacillus polymyxa]|uniref:hypothetical protein n=1 Tax=Paenibacillus polymyxa TaxID=1406 RepID=UPI001F0F334A|nr:hypothetical protein [Paenibacillus polymyxa]UMR35903.1 hypothetical protein MJ749_25320 [Paenibacillus polymyxa]
MPEPDLPADRPIYVNYACLTDIAVSGRRNYRSWPVVGTLARPFTTDRSLPSSWRYSALKQRPVSAGRASA